MTDAQIFTIVLPIVLALTALIYSNSRITDAKETLRAELGEVKQTLRAELADTRQILRLDIERVLSEIRQLRAGIQKHELLTH